MWSEDMVDRLQALKLIRGMEHEQAWRIALRENPPRGSEFRGMDRALTLIAESDEVDPVEWLRLRTREAWYGDRELLKHFTLDLLYASPLQQHTRTRRTRASAA
jgi:hypothetical protein